MSVNDSRTYKVTDRPHLEFSRIQRPPAARRKVKRGWSGVDFEDRAGHAETLENEAADVVSDFDAERTAHEDIDPKLIVVIDLGSRVDERDFERAGLRVLDTGESSVAVVFADDSELTLFRERLSEYQKGQRTPEEKGGELRSAAFESFYDSILHLRRLEPKDRMSERLKQSIEGLDEGQAFYFDVECWFVSDRAKLGVWMAEIREAVEFTGGKWLDPFMVSSLGLALVRCCGTAEVVEVVAKLDQVAMIDSIPAPRLERSDLAELQDVTDLDITDPPDDAPVIGIVDSGVLAGHPLLEPAVVEAVALHDEFGGQGEDTNGHGTRVAGITLYGDVEAQANAKSFEPEAWIASVRVLDGDGLVPEKVNFLRVIQDAVTYLAETWECRVINLSIGDSDSPYSGGRSTPLASIIDGLARSHGLVIVVSAGNLTTAEIRSVGDPRTEYPQYLIEGGFELLDPSQAAIALTVGAISRSDGVSSPTAGTNVGVECIADAGGPSPFTRSGPGVQGSIKPDLAADGGNLVVDAASGIVRADMGSSVVSTSATFPSRLFDVDVGTSFAAPYVTHLASRLVSEYPALSANSVRALLLLSASNATSREILDRSFEGAESEGATHSLSGHGVPTWSRSAFSTENRVVLRAEDLLRIDNFHVYRIPITDEFKSTAGPHTISVALAFDPPVRHRRLDYLGYRMEFVVVRGASLEDVYEMASAEFEDPEAGKLGDHELKMRPSRTARSRGTNQVATASSSQRPRGRFRQDWYIVVRNVNRWLPTDAQPQSYALAVSIEVERAQELFVELENEIRIELEAEVGA